MILVTGATGFVGRAVVAELARKGVAVRACVRRPDAAVPEGAQSVQIADLSAELNWRDALAGVSAVVHAAARVHVMDDAAADPLAEFRRINVAGTLNLAEQAAAAGVIRFVFISSIKVNGEATVSGRPFSASDTPAPLDAYGISKMEAEQGLREIARRTGMEVAIIRPPLVYGPGVKANFQAMMRWLKRGIPLPLGAIHNARSLVALDNLVALILACISHPAAANQTFLVSDGEDLSTTELLRRMGRAMGRPARLIPLPAALLRLGALAVGKPAIAQRLCGSLQVDISKTKELLAWHPPLSVDEGLRQAAGDYRSEASI
ncbi:N-acetyl-alpha-D-glucosaminyl-diphospho-ditrans,octacis-undecaprenol 4-epimerase [Burkholderia sp. AD24]|nr:N-acetyl-alpha-D-glucosaminyl-diphospho-ditrans,octacis-undecaprenol 4-epimerase [Burkholderia sp. AD24]